MVRAGVGGGLLVSQSQEFEHGKTDPVACLLGGPLQFTAGRRAGCGVMRKSELFPDPHRLQHMENQTLSLDLAAELAMEAWGSGSVSRA